MWKLFFLQDWMIIVIMVLILSGQVITLRNSICYKNNSVLQFTLFMCHPLKS